MDYLLTMSLSGSTMTVVYLVFRWLLKNKISARLHYLLSRVAVLYYLIPLPFLKGWYRKVLYRIMPPGQADIERISLTWTRHVLYADGKTYINGYTFWQAAAMIVWLFVVCILMAVMLRDYVRTSRVIAECADKSMTKRQKDFLAGIKKQYGVKQHVVLSRGYAGAHTMTFGVRRPVIICDQEEESKEARLIVSHEMVHIKRQDVLWKIIMQFVVILHWWNPLIRTLRQDFESDCECSCDEIVMQGKSEEEIQVYRLLLAQQVSVPGQVTEVSLRWKAGFWDEQNEIRERVNHLKVRKKWNPLIAGALAAVLAFVNSMTVFAYRDTFHETLREGNSPKDIESALHGDIVVFIPNGASQEEIAKYTLVQEPEILYEKQFMDAAGYIYWIPNYALENIFMAGYSHKYVSGTAIKHDKKPDGSCEGVEYRARRCSCGSVIWDQQTNLYQYVVCPHDRVGQEMVSAENER